MDFHVSLKGGGTLSDRIYRELRTAILDGRLPAGERLPPTRELARRLAVARNTVTVAFERLIAEGFVTGRVGAGTFVRAGLHGEALSRRAPAGAAIRARALWDAIVVPRSAPRTVPPYDFSIGVPDPRLFPLDRWRRTIARELRSRSDTLGVYGDPAGHAGLRRSIARHVAVARAVNAAAQDVVVTQGAQQALDLIGRVLISPGMTVAVEEPGYPPVRMLFQSLGARVAGVRVDAEGIDVDAIPKTARLVYVTPSHQFPLGTTMSLARRTALLEWAERRGAVIIEDDYDSEFRFAGRPVDPLQSLDRAGRVLYVGSFSKVMLPTLRLGFLVAPASLQPALRAAKQLSDWHSAVLPQAALARFIDDGSLARHVRRATRHYAARRQVIIDGIGRDFPAWLELLPSVAGLHVCAAASSPSKGAAIDRAIRRARDAGVRAEALSHYCEARSPRAGLVLGYGAIATSRAAEGMERLAKSLGTTA